MRRARRPRQVAALAAVIVLVAACSGDGLSAPSTPTGAVSTDTVSYQYILTNFNITIPPKVNTIINPGPEALTGQ